MNLIESLRNFFILLWGSQVDATLLYMRSVRWAQHIRNILFFAMFLGLAALFLKNYEKLSASLKKHQVRSHVIKIANRGNVPMVYLFRVISPDAQFPVEFSCNGYPLVQLKSAAPAPREIPEIEGPREGQKEGLDGTLMEKKGQLSGKADSLKEKMKNPSVKKGQEILKAVGTKTGLLARLVGSIAGFLPGGLKEKVQTAQQGVSVVQKKLNDASRLPDQVSARVDLIQRQAQSLSGTDQKVKTQMLDGVRVTKPLPPEPQLEKKERKQKIEKVKEKNVDMKPILPPIVYSKSPVVQAGGSIQIMMKITSLKPDHEKFAYRYDLEIQQKPQYQMNIPLVTESVSGIACFEKHARYERIYPYLILAGEILAGALFLFLFGMVLYR